MHTIHCVSFCQNGWILMIKSVDASAPKSVRINASCLERGYSEDSCTLQSLCHFLCYIFWILTNSGNWQSVTRIQYKQRQSLNFHKMALKSNSWKGNADAILETSMRILEVVRSEFWCDTGLGSLPFDVRIDMTLKSSNTCWYSPWNQEHWCHLTSLRRFACVTVISAREGLRTCLTHYFCQTAIKTCSGLVERGGCQLLTIKSCCPRSLRLEMETFRQRMKWELAQTFLCRIYWYSLLCTAHSSKIEKEDISKGLDQQDVVEEQRLLIPAKTTSPLGPLCTSQSIQVSQINSFKA